jgi:hypothetical protein
MTVPSHPNDDAPHRLLQATPLPSPLPPALQPWSGAAPDALRQLITSLVHTTLECEHEEIRRRTRVIRIFPNEASYLRLATALAADRDDAWAKRRYVVLHSTPTPTPAVAPKPVRRRRRAA